MRSPADQLSAAARAVHARARGGRKLPPGLAFTDPTRWRDPLETIARLPRGFGLVLRHGGLAQHMAAAPAIARACRRRGIVLLIGADIAMARRLRADGVHLPERMAKRAPGLPARWLVTAAWHPARREPPPRRGLDALVISPVFQSNSASATHFLGARRAHMAIAKAGIPGYALGGLTQRTAKSLKSSLWCGIAAVDGFRT